MSSGRLRIGRRWQPYHTRRIGDNQRLARHRGKDWGKKHRCEGQERIHWHEIKSAVIYRLKDQAQVSPKRRALLAKHVVALPAETDPVDFGQRVENEARNWCKSILHALKHHSPRKLFQTLADLLANPPRPDAETIAAIKDADDYFDAHRTHMDYPGAAKFGLPIGSGSMESQCSQFQNRFKRRGQFWTKKGFAGLLEVVVRHQNGELHSLWAA